MKHIKEYEEFINESKLNLRLSTNDMPVGVTSRYRLESEVINLRKVVNLAKEPWSKTARPFTDNELGFESARDRKEAMSAIQKSFDNGRNDLREFGLNESVVTEASAFMAKDVNKTVDFLNDETGGNPGYLFFGEDDDIEQFDKLWKSRRYQVALDMLAQDQEIAAQSLEDIKLFIKESVVNESFNAKYWEDYHEDSEKLKSGHGFKPGKLAWIDAEVEAEVEEWNDNNEMGKDNEISSAGEKKVIKLAKEFFNAKGWISSDVIQAMIAQEG
jgi:hypothetical protein